MQRNLLPAMLCEDRMPERYDATGCIANDIHGVMSIQAALAERLTPETTPAAQHVPRATTSTEQQVLLASNRSALTPTDAVIMLV